MLTLIFLDDNKQTVSICFTHKEEYNDGYVYGIWNVDTNDVYLNDNGWAFLNEHRKDIRKLKPMMDKLDKRKGQGSVLQREGGIKKVEYYPMSDMS